MRQVRPEASLLLAQPTGREGVSLIGAVVLITGLSALSLSALMMSNTAVKRQLSTRQQLAARYAADAGLAEAVARIRIGGAEAVADLQQPVDFGGARFWVESSTDASGAVSLVANGEMGNASFRQQLVVQEVVRSRYSYGAFGDESLELASNAHVDSYDSDLGLYETLRIFGSGQSAWAGEKGTIGSNRNILMRQNSRTYGDAMAGPSGTVTVMGNAFVTGSTGQAADLMVLDPIEFPAGNKGGALNVASKATVRLGAGTHVFANGNVGVQGTLEIQGPAKVVFDSFEVSKNARVVADSTTGLVEIYVHDDFVLSSNTLMAPRDLDPSGLALYLESDNIIDPGMSVDLDEIDFESNSKLYGSIYAPNANVIVNSNFVLYGSLVARRLRLDSNSQVHYDERLVEDRDEGQRVLEVIGWRVLPRRAPEHESATETRTETQPSVTTESPNLVRDLTDLLIR